MVWAGAAMVPTSMCWAPARPTSRSVSTSWPTPSMAWRAACWTCPAAASCPVPHSWPGEAVRWTSCGTRWRTRTRATASAAVTMRSTRSCRDARARRRRRRSLTAAPIRALASRLSFLPGFPASRREPTRCCRPATHCRRARSASKSGLRAPLAAASPWPPAPAPGASVDTRRRAWVVQSHRCSPIWC